MRHVLQTMFGLALCVLALEARAQTIVYVDADATGGNDGTSWEDAFINLQDALGAAGAGDEVWVASGTYYPDRGLGATPGDRSARFRLQSGVALFGGFSGAETQRLQRNPAVYPTVLSGDIATAGTQGRRYTPRLFGLSEKNTTTNRTHSPSAYSVTRCRGGVRRRAAINHGASATHGNHTRGITLTR